MDPQARRRSAPGLRRAGPGNRPQWSTRRAPPRHRRLRPRTAATGTAGATGTTGSTGATGATGTVGFSTLISTVDDACSDGTQINVGLDNGDGGGIAKNGILEAGEIDSTQFVSHSGNQFVCLKSTAFSGPQYIQNVCGSGSIYTSGSAGWSVSWLDLAAVAPTSVTVEINEGANCDNATTKTVSLNGVSQGSAFPYALTVCNCSPSTLITWTMTDLSGYLVGGTNTLTWNNSSSATLNPTAEWNGAVMRVTINH